MVCTKCPHNREIERLRSICSKCRLGDSVAGGGSVSLDAVTDGTLERIVNTAPNSAASTTFDPGTIDEQPGEPTPEERATDALTLLISCVKDIPFEHLPMLVRVAKAFEGLDKMDFGVVQHFLKGGTLVSYAEENGLTKQAALVRIKRLFKNNPIFKATANGRLLHGAGGRVKAKRHELQLELF